MFSTLDTIVAIATPPGRGGIGVVRISGPDAHGVARELTGRETEFQPRYAALVTVRLKADTTTADVASGFLGTPKPEGEGGRMIGKATGGFVQAAKPVKSDVPANR